MRQVGLVKQKRAFSKEGDPKPVADEYPFANFTGELLSFYQL